MPRKKTAQKVAESILSEQAQYLAGKWKAFKGGDPASALTDLEQEFLFKLKKLEQEAEVQEATVSYLENLSDGDLELFYQRIYESLPVPEDEA